MASKLYKKYAAKIQSGRLTETEIIWLRSALNRPNSGLDYFERIQLQQLVENVQPDITPEQTAKGLAWLNNLRRTPTRKTRKHNPFTASHEAVLDAFSHFKLVGLFDCASDEARALGIYCYQPIYRVFSKDGYRFDYVPYVMLSGKPPLLLSVVVRNHDIPIWEDIAAA